MTVITRISKIGKATLISNAESGSDEWHQHRANSIGGSDVASIMNVSPYRSALTLWAQKKQLIGEQLVNQAMLLGNFLEAGIVDAFRANHPDLTVTAPGGTWESLENSRFHANPDGFIENEFGDASVLEIKFTTQYWKELPEHYRYQVLWYMYVTGLHNDAIVCAVTGGGYREFIVQYDQSLMQDVKERVEGFLELLDTDTEPELDGSESTLETVREMTRPEDEEVELDEDAVRKLFDADQMLSVWQTQLNIRKAEVLKLIQGKRWGYVNGISVVSLQQRGEGKPFLKLERNTEWDS